MPDLPLPPDEDLGTVIYKNLRMIQCDDNQLQAYTIEGTKVTNLHSWKYKIVLDADEPWWEEKIIKVYSWRKFQGDTRYRQSSQLQHKVILHLREK